MSGCRPMVVFRLLLVNKTMYPAPVTSKTGTVFSCSRTFKRFRGLRNQGPAEMGSTAAPLVRLTL